MPDNANESSRQDEGESPEEKALIELKRMIERERPSLQSEIEDLEVINLGRGEETREIQRVVKLLEEYAHIFAWSYRNMPGLDIAIVEHRLPLIPNAILVWQQLIRIKPEVTLKIKEEVEKQWNAGFLAIIEYPQWVANIVPVPKKDGKVRMCVDYRDLNRASPKDNFPLPHIDMLVENMVQHTFYFFMDGFSRYNQIWIALEDKEKTTFITTWGTFCYKVMSFGLKNAGATY
ncbi:hypothetical protein CR513_24272, partial [Mucuna pruriens]